MRQRYIGKVHSGIVPTTRVLFAGVVSSIAWVGAQAADSEPQLQEVMVTATRTGLVNVQSTPMAISVLTPEALDSLGRGGISDFLGQLPSVNMQSRSPGTNDIEMRGLVTTAVDPTNSQERALVSVYLDDAAIDLQSANPDLHVYDLERVEIVRGPQGTLYGAGSMGGTVRLITKKPDSKSFFASGDASVSYTDFGGTNYSVRGVVNVPIITGQLAARVTAYRSEDSGYIDNLQLNETDANPAYSTQARLALRWTPLENLTVDLSATLARLNAKGRNAVYPQLGDYVYQSLTPEPFTDDFKLYNLTAGWNVGFATLISSTSYVDRYYEQHESFQYFDEYLATPGTLLPAANVNANDIHEFQEELRLVSDPNQKLHWTVGAYYERFSRFYPQTLTSPGFDAVFGQEIGDPTFNSEPLYGNPPGADVPFYGTIDTKERQYALFGEATYPILPNLDLTLGLRYFDFHETFDLFFTGIFGALAPGQPLTTSGDENASGINPRGVLAYKFTPNVMAYFEAARGFRFGGVNEPAPPSLCGSALAELGLTQSPISFGPDHLWSYTLGEKGTFVDRRLLVNVDAFFINWQDVQTVHDLSCGYYFTENKGNVHSRGLELESKFRATEALTLGLSGSYTNATANGAIPNLVAQDGDRTPFFPKTIVSVNGEYAFRLQQSARLILAADYTYRSNAFTAFNPADPTYAEIPSSTLVNGSLTYQRDRWSVGVYGTNLTNNHLVSSVVKNLYAPYQPGDTQYWGRPRTVGVHFHIDFD